VLQTIERPSAFAILARLFDAIDRHGTASPNSAFA
jgi:hypothetical protein